MSTAPSPAASPAASEDHGTLVMPGTEHFVPATPPATPTTPGGPGASAAPLAGRPAWVDLERIDTDPNNPRDDLGAVDGQVSADDLAANVGIRDLAASIAEQGLLEPLVLTHAAGADPDDESTRFTLVAGERRYRALRLLHATDRRTGPVLVILRADLADPARRSAAALVENLQRVDLSALQEARGYARLRDEFGWSQAAIARAIGRNGGHVSKRLALLRTVPLMRELIEAGTVPIELAVDFSKLDDALQQRAAREMTRGPDRGGLTPQAALAQAQAAADTASARNRAVRSLADAGLRYVELDSSRWPAASPHGPLPVDFPGYASVRAAHDGAPHGSLPCEVRYVTRTRTLAVVSDPGANTYPGFDPGFISGRYCETPSEHPTERASAPLPPERAALLDPFTAPAATTTGTALAEHDDEEETERAPRDAGTPAARTTTSTSSTSSTSSTPASTPASTPRREQTEATMLRVAFLQRLLTSKLPQQAAAYIAGALVTHVALDLDDPTVAAPIRDAGADEAALAHAMRLLGPRQAPLDASPVAARKAALAATYGPDAGVERRTRFALALTLARADQAITVATAALAASPMSPHGPNGVPAQAHVVAAQALTALSAWGHLLHPLEHLVIDTAPTPTDALRALQLARATPSDLAPALAEEEDTVQETAQELEQAPVEVVEAAPALAETPLEQAPAGERSAPESAPEPPAAVEVVEEVVPEEPVRPASPPAVPAAAGRVRPPTVGEAKAMSAQALALRLTRLGVQVPDGARKGALVELVSGLQ